MALLPACRQEMHDQPRIETLAASEFFEDGAGMRSLPEGVVPAGAVVSELIRSGIDAEGYLAVDVPLEIDAALLERGRERYEVFCAVCHGMTGEGDGMIVQRGFPEPTSFHSERLRKAPPGWFVNVIENGYGVMYSYAARVPPSDRWAITAYIRALQRSRQGRLEDVPPPARSKLEEAS